MAERTVSRGALVGAVLLALTGHAPRPGEDAASIGVLTDMSSVSADIMGAGSVLAAQMAVEDAGGSVAGTRSRSFPATISRSPTSAVAVARRWIEQNQVDAIVDIPNTSVALAINQIARDANIVFMPSSSGGLALTGAQCSPNTVRWTQDVWASATAIPKALMEGGANKTWYWIRPDVAYGADIVKMGGRGDRKARRQSRRHRRPPGRHDRLLVVHPAGEVLQCRRDRRRELQRRSHEHPQGRRRVRRHAGKQKIASTVLTINNVRAVGLNLTARPLHRRPRSTGTSTTTRAPSRSASTRGTPRRSPSTNTPPASTARCAIT